jgi:hypothetical protein
MNDIWKALAPHLVEALIGLIVAASSFAVAWLRACTEAQKQAVLGAAHTIDVRADVVPMPPAAKKAAAVRLAAQRLPLRLAQPTKLGRLVEDVMPDVKRARDARNATTNSK